MDRAEHKLHLVRLIRTRSASHIVDVSGGQPAEATEAAEAAIYTLSDPRDVRLVRYVGQTASPRRRFSQHLNAARLWLPDDVPWWIKQPELKSLYQWIRELYQDGQRLPVMMVTSWVLASEALGHERDLIFEHLHRRSPLFNRECESAKSQPYLI